MPVNLPFWSARDLDSRAPTGGKFAKPSASVPCGTRPSRIRRTCGSLVAHRTKTAKRWLLVFLTKNIGRLKVWQLSGGLLGPPEVRRIYSKEPVDETRRIRYIVGGLTPYRICPSGQQTPKNAWDTVRMRTGAIEIESIKVADILLTDVPGIQCLFSARAKRQKAGMKIIRPATELYLHR